MQERIILCVAVLAMLSLVTGMIQDWRTGWIQGVSILIALTLLVLIQSWNDWMKDNQFVRLANRALDEEVTVVRGKLGAM
jgi:P-type Ca2+ transporter type 2C